MKKFILIPLIIILIVVFELFERVYAQANRGYIYIKPPQKKSARPRMLEVEEELWFKLNQDLLSMQEELLKTKTELKIMQAELEEERRIKKEGEPWRKKMVYKVQKNDSLWKIAMRYYNDPFKWRWIYKANLKQVEDPNFIYPEQILDIPRH